MVEIVPQKGIVIARCAGHKKQRTPEGRGRTSRGEGRRASRGVGDGVQALTREEDSRQVLTASEEPANISREHKDSARRRPGCSKVVPRQLLTFLSQPSHRRLLSFSMRDTDRGSIERGATDRRDPAVVTFAPGYTTTPGSQMSTETSAVKRSPERVVRTEEASRCVAIGTRFPDPAAPNRPSLSPTACQKLRRLMPRLRAALDKARRARRSLWDCAVEIKRLRKLGFADNDFRWLVCKGYIEHAKETTPRRGATRTFERRNGLSFCRRTCFVLTESGVEFARALSRTDEVA